MQPDTPVPSIGHDLRDGFEVHRAALARGLDVTLLPRQVMLVQTPGDDTTATSFVHGLPQTSTLSGATYAQDVRMRRAMLASAGFTIPKGATFSVGRSARAGRRYAEKIGYPVVAKPALGDNTVEVFAGIADERGLNRAIRYFREPPESRSDYLKAAYALTELREPGIRNGKPTAPPGYRFLIEKHIVGQYLRLLVLNGEVRSVILCPVGPWRSESSQLADITVDTHTSTKAIAVAVTKALPGVPLAAVDLVVEDYTTETSVEAAQVVEFSERPWLAVQASLDPHLSATLGDEILRAGTQPIELAAPRDDVTMMVRLDGSVRPGDLLATIDHYGTELGLTTGLQVSDPTMGHLSGTMRGRPATIAWLMESLIAGSITTNPPMQIELLQAERY